ncbi:MAG: PDZ domain-containing protein [Clostridia bacterium]|nr:PDZ domain-containing protein [Clostridia bacterium]
MNKKISLGLAIALIIVSVTATFAITMSVSQRIYNNLITDLPDRAQMYSAVEEIDEIIRSKYYGEIDQNVLDSNLENGYVKGLGDQYSYYMSAEEYSTYYDKLEGKSSGVGIETQLDTETGYILVTEVYPGSSAQAAGLKKGDMIIEIAEETVDAQNYDEMVQRLSGTRLTSVNVTYRRDDVDKTVSIVLGYSSQTVSYELIGTAGYIKISAFYKTTRSQLEKAVDSLTSQGAKSLIFDVRGTTEGTIEYTSRVIDYLVPVATEGNKAIATLVDKNGKTVKTYSSDADNVSMPMSVLINSQTSGCAELFACDLRDFGRAVLVGDTTAGNAGVQELFELSNGAAIVLTTSKVLPYISESYDAVGLEPDTSVSLTAEQQQNLSTLSHEDDIQLQTAIAMLSDNSEG